MKKQIVLGILAIIAGVVVGSIVNMGLVIWGSEVFPFPVPLDSDREILEKVIPNLEFKYFIFPFLAHALGTLTGALTAGLIKKEIWFALSIGALFLVGGILSVFSIPAPIPFVVVDLVFAYIPMAFAGWKLSKLVSKNR